MLYNNNNNNNNNTNNNNHNNNNNSKTFKLKKIRSIKIHQRRVNIYNHSDSSIGFHTHYCLSFLISIHVMAIIYNLVVAVRRRIKHPINKYKYRQMTMLTYFKLITYKINFFKCNILYTCKQFKKKIASRQNALFGLFRQSEL